MLSCLRYAHIGEIQDELPLGYQWYVTCSRPPYPMRSGEAGVRSVDGRPPTPRDLEILELLANGATTKQVAARLTISQRSVQFHVEASCDRLGCESRTHAVARAVARGLIVIRP